MLSAARMAQMSRLLDEALELDPEGRRRWLEALSPEYDDLKPAMQQALLPEGSKCLETIPKVGVAQADDGGLRAAQRIGPYQLVRPLGRGGMAQGWLGGRAAAGVAGAERRRSAPARPAAEAADVGQAAAGPGEPLCTRVRHSGRAGAPEHR